MGATDGFAEDGLAEDATGGTAEDFDGFADDGTGVADGFAGVEEGFTTYAVNNKPCVLDISDVLGALTIDDDWAPPPDAGRARILAAACSARTTMYAVGLVKIWLLDVSLVEEEIGRLRD